MQISDSDIVELSSANILRKLSIQNKQQLSLRVQQSDDMGGKSFYRTLWSCTKCCTEPFSRGQHGKQSMVRVGGASDNIPRPGHAALGSSVLNGEERSPNVLLHCPHHSPQIPPVRGCAVSTPHGDAAGQDALYGAPAECSEDGPGQEGSPHPSQAKAAVPS